MINKISKISTTNLEDNNNNNNNNKDIKLNCFIFKEISIYLAYKSNFKNLINYSLLSKTCFKIFQNLITYNSDLTKVIIPFESLLKYLKEKQNQTQELQDNQYKFSLLQYKETEFLLCKIYNQNIISIDINDYIGASSSTESVTTTTTTTTTNSNRNERILFKKQYPILENIKRIHFLQKEYKTLIFNNGFNKELYKKEEGEEEEELFTYETLRISWNIDKIPISNLNECKKLLRLLNSDDNDSDGDSEEIIIIPTQPYSKECIDKIKYFNFNFNTISKFKPSKIYIDGDCGDETLQLNSLSNILKQLPQLESITFSSNNTTPTFINNAITNNSNKIKSFTVLLDLDEDETDDQTHDDDDDDEGILTEYDKILKYRKLFLKAFSNLSNNKSLKKLVIRPKLESTTHFFDHYFGLRYNDKELINLFFNNCLSSGSSSSNSNKNITTLGIEFFNIENHELLEPLINQYSNIKTLHCECDSLKVIGAHCNKNQNITSLKVFLGDCLIFEKPYYIFQIAKFLKRNQSQNLKLITFVHSYPNGSDLDNKVKKSITKVYQRYLKKKNFEFNKNLILKYKCEYF